VQRGAGQLTLISLTDELVEVGVVVKLTTVKSPKEPLQVLPANIGA
jgi:hypothetical protein